MTPARDPQLGFFVNHLKHLIEEKVCGRRPKSNDLAELSGMSCAGSGELAELSWLS